MFTEVSIYRPSQADVNKSVRWESWG